jgi:hypothetical protein
MSADGVALPSAAMAALDMPELLTEMFSYLPPHQLAIAATVSQRWSPLALDALWWEIPDLSALTHLLDPVLSAADPIAMSAWSLPRVKPANGRVGKRRSRASQASRPVRGSPLLDGGYALCFQILAHPGYLAVHGSHLPPSDKHRRTLFYRTCSE